MKLANTLTAAAMALAASSSASALTIIDNFKATELVSAQVVSDNTMNGQANVATFTQGPGAAIILGGVRQVSVNLYSAGPASSNLNAMFTNNGAQVGLGSRDSAGQVVFSYSGLSFDAAAAGSTFTLPRVMNHMPSGQSSSVNTPEKAIAVGQTVTLMMIDSAGQQAALPQPIPYLGTQFNPYIIENSRFNVSFGLAALLGINPLLNLADIADISLTFDVLNASGFPEVIYLGDNVGSGLTLSGDPFPFTPPPPVPEPASWALMLAGAGGMGLWMRRRQQGN